MQSRREQLSPAVRAKTILASCDQVALRVVDTPVDDSTSNACLGVYLDRSGATYVVVPQDRQTPSGTMRISCRTSLPGLGVLRLDGTSGERLTAHGHPTAHHALCAHAPHGRALWEVGTHYSDPANLELVEIDLEAVHVLAPATATERAQCLRVALPDFTAARADLWCMNLQPHCTRLERHHQEPLRALVRANLDPAAGSPSTVLVRDLRPEHIELACLTDEGVASIRLSYGQQLDNPVQVAHWVTHAAARLA